MPAALLDAAALADNIAAMQAFADAHGAWLCPHGKTSLSPQIFRLQMEAGAWGMTAATPRQARLCFDWGIGRVLLANPLVGRADTDALLGALASDPGRELYCLVDSEAAVRQLAEGASRAGLGRPLPVLVESGLAGGRAGARSVAAALAVARAAAAQPLLTLRGVELFEGLFQARADGEAAARETLRAARAAAEAIAEAGLFAPGDILFSAGGSAFLDLCLEDLPPAMNDRRLRPVLRPGCYVTHDHGIYRRLTEKRETAIPLPRLRPALEVWGTLLSLPEPGLAIIGVGRRDVSSDVEPPIPLWVHRPGRPGPPRRLVKARVMGLWDQHLALAAPGAELAVGDLLGFGISHPCSTLDRWRKILTVDEERRVTGAVDTAF